ncbi:MAG: 2-oxoacid:acceptor oxidoreductase family protein [Bacteroidetes bacterium]|nr:2-oxoacid:acceptor oxidoreductase family protein [Bacteroidota bacterium]MBU2584127.1 2-oxoacid:acceptor oxidoreductase family protein [Bacteroidota bacterium]
MKEETIFSGFGGQGVLSMGMVLCYAGMKENKEVCFMPSYGPEMRGGTANCITIISNSAISSPIISRFDSVVALNQPSVDKFEKTIKPGGSLIYDSTNVINPPIRSDINIYAIPGSEEAVKLNNMKVLNMIMLGAYLKVRSTVTLDSTLLGLKEIFPERYHKIIPLNIEALEIGMSLANN